MDKYSKLAGKNFRQLLDRLNITQETAANIISVDERTIRRWIKEGIDRLSTLEIISKKFNVDLIETFLKD